MLTEDKKSQFGTLTNLAIIPSSSIKRNDTAGAVHAENFSIDAIEEENGENEPLLRRLQSIPPDGGYGWVIVFGAFLSNFVCDGISVSQGVLMEDIRKSSGNTSDCGNETYTSSTPCTYEITVAMYGLISAVLQSISFFAGPFISLLINNFGFRKVAVGGSFLASLGIFISWITSRSQPHILIIIGFFGGMSGIGFGMIFQTSITIVGLYFEKWRPLATGIAMMGTGAGTVIFPPLLAYIAKILSWREAYLCQAIVVLISATFGLLYCPIPTQSSAQLRRSCENLGDRVPSVEKSVELKGKKTSMSPLISSPTFMLLSISGMIMGMGFFCPYAFLVDRVIKELKVDVKSATFLLSTLGIANTLGRLVFGLISCHPRINCLTFSNLATTLGGVATMMVPFTLAYYQMVIYTIVFGFCLAIVSVLRSTVTLKLLGIANFNNAFGLSLLFLGVGALLGNPLGGWLKDTTGNYDASFYSAGGCILVASFLSYPLQIVHDWENSSPRLRRRTRYQRTTQETSSRQIEDLERSSCVNAEKRMSLSLSFQLRM